MEKHLLPLLCFIIAIAIFNVFKPTSEITYQDHEYINKLTTCSPYVTEGKLTMIGNESSKSIIKGAKNGKCIIQTINKFTNNRALATTCSLNKLQLKELSSARQNRIYEFGGYNDGKIIARFKKEGACKSYTLKDKQWIKTK